MSSTDWFIVAAYVGGLVLFGTLVARRNARPEDYFLASRSSRWPAIGMALIASNISSTALVGLAGAAYGIGLSVYDYEWSAIVVLIFYCIFLLPYVLRARVYTMPEFLERRYDKRARIYLAVLTLFLNVFVDCAGALYSGSLVCQLLFPGLPIWLFVMALAGAAGLYTTIGGLRAVIYTETVQAVVLFIGAVVIACAAFLRAGGWHEVMSRVDPAKLSLIRPIGDAGVPWPGLLLGIPLIGFYYWCTNQSIAQRVLSAKDLDHGRRGALLAAALKLPVFFLMVLPGTCAIILFPNLSHPNLVYPTLIFQLLPVGLMGLVAASFVAATMASVASTLNSAATLLTMDVIHQLRPALSDGVVVRIGKLCTAGFLAIAMLWAPQLERFPSLWQYLQSVLAYAVPPVVALFLVGMFWRRANAAGAAATLLFGSACGLLLFLGNGLWHWFNFHFLYAIPILMSVDCAILVAVSWRTGQQPAPGARDLVWTAAAFRADIRRSPDSTWWQSFTLQSAVLLGLTAALVLVFR